MKRLSYEDAANTFKLALNDFGICHRQAWMKPDDEAAVKKSDGARLKCVSLYCELLTKLGEARIEL